MTIRDFLAHNKHGVSKKEVLILLTHILGVAPESILLHPETPLSNNQQRWLSRLIQKRSTGIPLAYITKEKSFFGRDFHVSTSVLVPRPETELLVEKALQEILDQKQNISSAILELGTGSGCVSITIACEMTKFLSEKMMPMILATDISANALRVAGINRQLHNQKKNITFFLSNLLSNKLLLRRIGSANLEHLWCLANLPYVPTSYIVNKNKKAIALGIDFEPKIALDGGVDGLDIYRKLLNQLIDLSRETNIKTIRCFFEIDSKQKKILERMFRKYQEISEVSFEKDYASLWRLCCFSIKTRVSKI